MNNTLYSTVVDKYINMTQNIFLLPDNVMVKDGVACGDSITMIGEINNDIVEFKIDVNGCMLCTAASNLIFEKYNNKSVSYVMKDCSIWINEIHNEPKRLLSFFEIEDKEERLECLLSPIEMFINFIKELNEQKIEICEIKDTRQQLDCDACVNSSRINWNGDKSIVKKVTTEPEQSTEYKEKWGKVSKVYLNSDEVKMLRVLYENMNDDDFKYIRHEKIEQAIYSNLLNFNIDISNDTRWKNVIYQVHRKYIVQGEIQNLKNYINDNNINAHFVKGAYNGELYVGNNVRTHLDYDLIAMSEEDAFKLGNYLFRNGYTISAGVFSLKKMIINETSVYSGHYHVQKIINDQYKIVIDVNFPEFPMGRICMFKPKIENGHICNEDQLIITLCHAFKHKDVYIKDINDIYLMVKNRNLNYKYIEKRLKENDLTYYASILFAYIFENYNLEETVKINIKTNLDLDLDIYRSLYKWPYDSTTALNVKKNDLNERLKSSVDNIRIYLYPLCIFKEYYYIENMDTDIIENNGFIVRKLSDRIYEIKYEEISFILLNIGLFLDNSIDVSVLGRKKIRLIIERFLRISNYNKTFDVPYALKTRKIWYN